MLLLYFLFPLIVFSQMDKVYRYSDFINNKTNLRRQLNVDVPLNIPDSIDWVSKSMVTDTITGQYSGTCWLWSAVSTLETNFGISTGNLIKLSKQFILDCNIDRFGQHWGTNCGGGRYDSVFDYVISKGIYKDSDYPWINCNQKCHFLNNTYGFLSGYDILPLLDHFKIKQYLTKGSLTSLIDLNYVKNGNIANCIDNTKLYMNHAVQIVGYGVENNTPYFKIKNSWGDTWEDGGFLKINATTTNVCGINIYAIYPIVGDIIEPTTTPTSLPSTIPTTTPIKTYNNCQCNMCYCN